MPPNSVEAPIRPTWRTVERLGNRRRPAVGEILPTAAASLILNGTVALFQGVAANSPCLGLMSRGGFHNLIEILTGDVSPLVAVVIQPATVLTVSNTVLRDEWATSPFFAKAVLCEARASAEEARARQLCATQHTATHQLAGLILKLAENAGDGSAWVSQQRAARLLNVRRATISVSASILEAAGTIARMRGGAKIVDRPRLEAAACDCWRSARRLSMAPAAAQSLAR